MTRSTLHTSFFLKYLVSVLVFVWFFVAAAQSTAAEDATSQKVSFRDKVAPILVKNCVSCHGEKEPNGEFQLHTFEELMQPGATGEASITAHDVDASYLYLLLTSDDEFVRMPYESDPLPQDEIAVIKRWIEQGAEFDGPNVAEPLTAIVPQTAHPLPPERYRVPVPVTAVAFQPDGKRLAASGYHEVLIWDYEQGRLLQRLTDVAERTYGLEFNSAGTLLAVASGTPAQLGEVRLMRLDDSAKTADVRILGRTIDAAFDVAFSPDNEKLAACGADRAIRIYDVKTGGELLVLEDHADWVTDVSWDSTGNRIASASRDKTCKVFDANTGESLITYQEHGGQVQAVAFSSDGTRVYSAGRDAEIHVWNPNDAKKSDAIKDFGGEIFTLKVAGDQLFACGAGRMLRSYAVNDFSQQRTYEGPTDWVFSLSVHPAEKMIAAGTFDGSVHIWDRDDHVSRGSFLAAPGLESSMK